MDAEKLQQAAANLRLRVGKLTTDTERWDEAFQFGGVYGDHSTYERLFVHPRIGLTLADWLDEEFSHDFGPCEYAIIIAELIMAGL